MSGHYWFAKSIPEESLNQYDLMYHHNHNEGKCHLVNVSSLYLLHGDWLPCLQRATDWNCEKDVTESHSLYLLRRLDPESTVRCLWLRTSGTHCRTRESVADFIDVWSTFLCFLWMTHYVSRQTWYTNSWSTSGRTVSWADESILTAWNEIFLVSYENSWLVSQLRS